MIRKTIAKIRRQPKHVRDKIALGLAGSFTAIIFVFWAYQTPSRMSELNKKLDPDEAGLMTQFMGNVGKQVSTIKDAFPQKSEETDSLIETNPYQASSTDYQMLATTSTDNLSSDTISSSTTVHNLPTTSTQSNNEQREVRIVTIKATSSSISLPNQ